MRLIFELSNLHHLVMKTTKRTLNVLVTNQVGENVLPNIDFCDDLVNLRRYLHHINIATLHQKRKVCLIETNNTQVTYNVGDKV
jgi:hypothetical protein